MNKILGIDFFIKTKYLYLHSILKNTSFFYQNGKCESSSVGRARPCQGRGREFESRLSLQVNPGGGIGRHAGLKIL
jgi:hypothetical protein